MKTGPMIAFAVREPDSPGLEVRVNFGMLTGREATAAEIDELAHRLVPEVGEVSIVAEQRHEVSEETEVSIHQVRIELADEQLPADPAERRALEQRIVEEAIRWADACEADRHVEVDAAPAS
jgi:hypothetical protein